MPGGGGGHDASRRAKPRAGADAGGLGGRARTPAEQRRRQRVDDVSGRRAVHDAVLAPSRQSAHE